MASALLIERLASTSPTLAEEMRLCPLRAGLASCHEAASWVLHDPRLWLGHALHALLERARHEQIPNLEVAWDAEIARSVERIESHQFDRRFSNPSRWPSYFLVRQRAFSSAAALNAARRPSSRTLSEWLPVHSGTERRLVARGGRLVGRPDRFNRSSVIDIKSNLPDRTTAVGMEIFNRYRRQVQIYAAIIAENFNFWPRKGIIAGASGETAEFDLVPAECDGEADAAVEDLVAWNQTLSSNPTASTIATPSDPSCGSCRYQLICPAFWTWLKQSGLSSTSKAPVAVAGLLKSVQLGNDGDLQTITLASVVSTHPGMTEASLVTRRSIHGTLLQSDIGAECRVIGADMRRDGRLTADWPTVLMLSDKIPQIDFRHGPVSVPS
jgi:hypothetical protein